MSNSLGRKCPCFSTMSGGSVGLQSGAEHQDVVLLMNQQGADELKRGHWDLGVEASAAGPSGAKEATEGTRWKAPVLSYSSCSAASAGADVGGSKVGADRTRFTMFTTKMLRFRRRCVAKCKDRHLHNSFCLPGIRWTRRAAE